MASRYAIYFAPRPQAPLAAFGAATLGYDADQRREVPFLAGLETASVGWALLVAEPSKYGFHATLKAPFELRAEASEATLLSRAEDIARTAAPCSLGRLRVAPLTRFVALMPIAVPECLQRLESHIVKGFEPLRAPLAAADRARRLKTPLTDQQIRYLDGWGYPYVLEEFRFHMTLAGPVPQAQIVEVAERLALLYEPYDEVVRLDEITVFRQTSRDARFHVMERFGLGA
jgi:hypothetical protein